jgi:hypothetical protein
MIVNKRSALVIGGFFAGAYGWPWVCSHFHFVHVQDGLILLFSWR